MYDAAFVNATSTSVSLLYRERPVLNFAAYVSRMEEALRGSFEDTLQLSWDHDDMVVIDIDGSRVLLGYWEAPQGDDSAEACEAVLVLSVGPGPDWRSQTRLARHRKALCQSVIAGILDRNPADMVLWKDFQGVFTPDDFETLVEQAIGMSDQDIAEGADFPADSLVPADMAETGPEVAPEEPGDERFGNLPVRRLMDRLETEIRPTRPQIEARETESDATDGATTPPARRRSRRPDWRAEWEAAVMSLPAAPDEADDAALDSTATELLAANDLPDLPLPQASELDRIRSALYPDEQAGTATGKPPLAQRLTIYTVNTSLMLVALPVGAALMTYNILGGEDFKTTARAVALTGAAIGLAHSVLGQYVMSMV